MIRRKTQSILKVGIQASGTLDGAADAFKYPRSIATSAHQENSTESKMLNPGIG